MGLTAKKSIYQEKTEMVKLKTKRKRENGIDFEKGTVKKEALACYDKLHFPNWSITPVLRGL